MVLVAFPRLEAAFYDLDGTLVDTEALLERICRELITVEGRDPAGFDYMEIVGKPAIEACRILVARFGLKETPESFRARRRERLHELIATDLRPMPGAEACLKKAVSAGARRGLVTSSDDLHVQTVFAAIDFRPYFGAVITTDTSGLDGRFKPDPAPYVMAAEMLKVNRFRCVVFEDSVAGALSGREAGMIVVAAPNRFTPRERFKGVAHYTLPEGQTLADFEFSVLDHVLPQLRR